MPPGGTPDDQIFRLMAENVQSGLTIIQNDLIVYVNPFLCELFGVSEDKLRQSSIFDFATDEEQERLQKIQKIAKADQKYPQNLQFWIQRPDGSKRFISNHYTFHKRADGSVQKYIITNDITERSKDKLHFQNVINELEVIQTLWDALHSNYDLKHVYQAVYHFIPKFFPKGKINRVNLLIYDPKLDGLISDPYIGINGIGKKSEPQPIGHSISGICFRERRTIYVPDCSNTEYIPPEYVDELGLKSTLALPVVSGKEVRGVLRVDNTDKTHAFQKRDIEVLSIVSEQIAFSIESALLFEELRLTQATTRAMYDISKAVLTTESLGKLYEYIHQSLKNVIECNNFYIALLDRKTDTIIFPYSADEKMNHDQQDPMDLADLQSLTAEVIRKREPLLLPEPDLQKRYQSGSKKTWGAQPKCWMGVPLLAGQDVMGALAIQSYDEPFVYTRRDVELFQSMAAQIAFAIQRKRTEDAFHESEEKYRMMVENSNDAIVISQSDHFIFFNHAFAEILGYEHDELIGINYQRVHTKEAVRVLYDRMERRNRGEEVSNRYETSFQRKDGSIIPLEANVAIINYKGSPATFAVLRDISEQKRILSALQKSLDNAHPLENFIPICASCKKIRDEKQEGHPWVTPEKYITSRIPDISFSHGICPDCMKKLYPDYRTSDDEG